LTPSLFFCFFLNSPPLNGRVRQDFFRLEALPISFECRDSQYASNLSQPSLKRKNPTLRSFFVKSQIRRPFFKATRLIYPRNNSFLQIFILPLLVCSCWPSSHDWCNITVTPPEEKPAPGCSLECTSPPMALALSGRLTQLRTVRGLENSKLFIPIIGLYASACWLCFDPEKSLSSPNPLDIVTSLFFRRFIPRCLCPHFNPPSFFFLPLPFTPPQ